MGALLLSLALFTFWLLLGAGVLAVLVPHRSGLAGLLLAPAIGLSLNLLPVFWLSRLGWPVGRFALPLAGLLLTAVAISNWRRQAAWREYLPFAALLAAAALLTGWPMLKYGFDWLSYCNDDMTNYALLAQRFLDHGFFDVPSAEALLGSRDYSSLFWVQGLVERCGSELVLSWVSGITGIPAPRVFMPVILAYHISLLSAAAALIRGATRRRSFTLISVLLMSLSPLVSLGTLYQLMGQMAGLTMLLACLAALTTVPTETPRWREGLLLAILLSGLLLLYPEVLPFLVATVGFWMALDCWSRSNSWRNLLGAALVGAPIGAVFLGRYLLCAMSFLWIQVSRGVGGGSDTARDFFAYYLLPSGSAALWGLQSLVGRPREPWCSLGIAAAVLLLLFSALSALRRWRERNAVLIGMLVMLSVAAVFFFMRSGFGLYKIAMYIQPFLWGSLVIALMDGGRHRRLRTIPLLLMGLICARTQFGYVDLRRGDPSGASGAFVEIRGASSSRITREIENLARAAGSQNVLLDTSNVVLAKLQFFFLRGSQATAPFWDLNLPAGKFLKIPQAPELESAQSALGEAWRASRVRGEFAFGGEGTPVDLSEFFMATRGQPDVENGGQFAVAVSTSRQSLLNRRRFTDDRLNFRLLPWNGVRDHLIFIESSLGRLYFAHDVARTALYQLESDYFFPGRTMVGLGRRLLFQVIHPSAAPRMVVEITASLKGDGENRIPPAAAVGKSPLPFAAVGRGSARLFSGALSPQVLGGRPFLGLDMGVEGSRWRYVRTGLMRLYGTGIPDDPRRLTCFGRDISLVSSDEYAALEAPQRIDSFPKSLADRNLEYSGIYEDGWLSEQSYFFLRTPAGRSAVLEVKGMVPLIDDPSFTTTCLWEIDGRVAAEKTLGLGEFVITSPVPSASGRIRIALTFSRWQRLPGVDGRPVAARIQSAGFGE